MTAGYSGTPLARKLSLKDGQRVHWEAMPASVCAEIEGAGLSLTPADDRIDAAHVFVTACAALEEAVARLLRRLARDGQLWVSWPKKASRSPDRRHRGRDPRRRAAARAGRREGLRGRRDLVRPQAGDPPGAEVSAAGEAEGRIASLDLLRGVAVMGIFSVNVVGFAMPGAGLSQPGGLWRRERREPRHLAAQLRPHRRQDARPVLDPVRRRACCL